MSFSSTEKSSRKIKRTLCIGIGGTGRDVLMQIRRLIIDHYGKLSELPAVSFVHIDADRSAGDFSGLKTGNTYHGEDLLFREAERVTASMSSQEIDALVHGLERRVAHERQSPYDHIGSWLSPHLLQNIKAIENGASGIRPVGRLTFFHNFRKIQKTIQEAENRTRGHEQRLLEKGIEVESGLNIFIVGSLCGGTGSGMFLDVAYSLRHTFGSTENQLMGYWVISPELYGNNPSMNANTYAALKELNHYSASNTCFEACYDPQHLVQIREQRPPFDFMYLVSNQTAKDYKILSKTKLCNVIANKIFLDFGAELTSVIQGQKNNFLERLTRTDEHPRRNVQNYLTFGLAKLYFPQDLTVQVALNQVKQKLLDFWLTGAGQSPDPQMLLDQFILNWGSDRSNKNPFISQLEALTQDHNKTFSQVNKAWQTQIEERINAFQNQDDRQQFLEQFPGEAKTQFRKVQPGETDSNRGIWLTLIQQSTPKLTQKLKQDIMQCFSELLDPYNVNFALTNARTWLEALTTYLNKQQRELEEVLQELNGLHSNEDIDKKCRNRQQVLQDIEKQSNFLGLSSFLGLNDKKKNQRFQDEAQPLLREISKLARHNFDYMLHQEALRTVKDLQKSVQALSNQSSTLNTLLKSAITLYEKQREDLVNLNEDDMTGEALFGEEDTVACYQEFLPEKEQRSTLSMLSTKALEAFGFERSIAFLILKDRLIEEKQVYETVNRAVEQCFDTLSIKVKQSVIQRFLQKYSAPDAEKRMKQILREAEPLLPLNLSDLYFYNDKGKKSEIIGFNQSDTREVHQFQDLLTRNLGLSENIFKPIQNDSEIFVVNEYAAFPLRLIEGLDVMREHYNRQYQLDARLLHNDYCQIFCDPIPPDARRVEELQDIFYTCLAFGILEKNSDLQRYLYQYFDDFRNCWYTIELSVVWNEALEQLTNSQDITDELKHKRDQILKEIQQDPSQWTKIYLPKLRDFIAQLEKLPKDDPNFPEISTVLGTKAAIDIPAQEGILGRLWNYLNQSLLSNSLNSQKSLSGNEPTESSQSDKISPEIVLDDVLFEETKSQPSSLTNELQKLSDLKQSGLLSEKEFEQAKKQILNV